MVRKTDDICEPIIAVDIHGSFCWHPHTLLLPLVRSSSTIDGKPMDYFPPSESRKRFFFSQTVILGLILLVIGVVASIFWLKFFLAQVSTQTYMCNVAFFSREG